MTVATTTVDKFLTDSRRTTLRLPRARFRRRQNPQGRAQLSIRAEMIRRHIISWTETALAALIATPLALIVILSVMPELRYSVLTNAKLVNAVNFFVFDDAGPPPPPNRKWLARLKQLDVTFVQVPDRKYTKGKCGYEGAVRVTRIGDATLDGTAVITWPMAVRLEEWLRTEVQPNAMRLFGRPITSLRVSSSYDCRMVKSKRVLSQHAYANAIDISRLFLAGGREIRILGTWNTKGAFSTFLHRIGKAACGIFPVALTPDFDYQHRHHFHLDSGRSNYCGYGKRGRKLLYSQAPKRTSQQALAARQ
ncbi:MAG: extensin family protein [Alphaproteobacteria bacterium]|nr:extensin family protein [Alphaproteobacteria bacterium]